MKLLQSAKDTATEWLYGEPAKESAGPSQEGNEQDLLGNQEVAARTDTGEGVGRAGTVVAKAGDTVSGLAAAGTGDAKRYRELNIFNQRDAEDASLEPGDILYVPAGWDIVAMGGSPEPGVTAPAEPGVQAGESHAETMPGVWDIVAMGQEKLNQAKDVARSAYDAAYGAVEEALWGPQDDEATIEEQVEQAAEQELLPGTGAEQGLDAGQREQYVRYTEDGEVDQRVEGASPLEIALEQAKKGDAGTTYKIDDAALRKAQSGDPSATDFWCSGFMIWSLAAYGMNVDAAIKGANGKDYSYKNPGGKQYPITIKRMMDGEPETIGAMDYAASKGIEGGYIGQVGVEFEAGYGESKFEGEAEDHALAVKGAAGAFEMAGIGSEVPELDQRPGDFNQARWKGNYRYYDGATDSWETDYSKPVDYYGQGHAWMTGEVVVTGSAWVGLEGSPLVNGAPATEVAWVEGATLTLNESTDPSLVGECGSAQSARRIEANTRGGMEAANKKDNNGGLQVTSGKEVPARSSYDGYVVYTGRLGGTPWAGHVPASRDRPPAGVEIPGLDKQPAVDETEESWMDWGRRKLGV